MKTLTKKQIIAAGVHLQRAVRILSPCAHAHPKAVKSKPCPAKPKKAKRSAKPIQRKKSARETVQVAYEQSSAPPLCSKDLRRYPIKLPAHCRNGRDAAMILHDEMNRETQEVTVVLGCDVRGRVIDAVEVSRGQKSRVGVGIDDVMYAVIRMRCETFVLAHYHPTGIADPSTADTDLTQTVFDACIPFGGDVTFVDHVVVGHKQAFSYAPAIAKAYESNGKKTIQKEDGMRFRL